MITIREFIVTASVESKPSEHRTAGSVTKPPCQAVDLQQIVELVLEALRQRKER